FSNQLEALVVEWRRYLHMYPEIRWEENETLAYIRRQLELNLAAIEPSPFIFSEMTGGLVVDLIIPGKTEMVLFRADVDALAVSEQTGLPYTSKVPGKMHACGHDMHSAMLMGAIVGISRAMQVGYIPTHNIRFVFQRAEENPVTESGGASLVKGGVLEGVKEAYGLHVWATGEAGTFLSRSGVTLGNSDRMKIEIKTTGGHVAMANEGVNAIDVVSSILNGLSGFGGRFLGDTEPVSIHPTIVNSGTASNVRPANAEMWYSARNFLGPDKRKAFHEALKARVCAIARVYPDPNLKVNVTIINGHPTLQNTAPEYEKTKLMLDNAGFKTIGIEPQLGGEDFAWYLKLQGGVPGVMWMIGANQEGCGGHHAPTFNPSESVLKDGVHFWLLLAYGE
ncbi:MAG: amidohydrolase, partial [Candidatus Paceibacterota bacterium]